MKNLKEILTENYPDQAITDVDVANHQQSIDEHLALFPTASDDVKELMIHAMNRYGLGYDFIVECWGVEDYEEALQDVDLDGAKRILDDVAGIHKEREAAAKFSRDY